MAQVSRSLLITGGSSGLGLCLALQALRLGHKVVATARSPAAAAQKHPDLESLGGHWESLDVTLPSTTNQVVQIVDKYQVNVLINNAGYAILGSLEDTLEDEFELQINTNVLGPMRCIKGCLERFRSLKESGGATIVNIGSLVCFRPFAGTTAYTASKRALEGLSETLAPEVGPHGTRVVLIDFGIFRTSFLNHTSKPASGLGEAYLGSTVDQVVNLLDGLAGKQPGNPELASARILDVLCGEGVGKDLISEGYGSVLRVPLGSDAWGALDTFQRTLRDVADRGNELACSTDYPKDLT